MKTWNLLQTSVFTYFQHIQVADPSANSNLKSQQNQPWNLYYNLVQTNLQKSQNLLQTGSQEDPKIHQKIIKIQIWVQDVLPGVPLDPRITKMVSQVSRMEPPGLQNNDFRYKK